MDTQERNAELLQEIVRMIDEQTRWIEEAQKEVERLNKLEARLIAQFKLPDVIGNSIKRDYCGEEITLTAKAFHLPIYNAWTWCIETEDGHVWDGDDSDFPDAATALAEANAVLARMVAKLNPGNGTDADGIPFA